MDKRLEMWREEGIEVGLHEPRPDNPRYRAFIEEFAIEEEGDTLDDALAALFSKLSAYIESSRKAEQPLPPRPPDSAIGDERADQIDGG